MELSIFEQKFTNYIENNVIMKFFQGLERFKILFILPFKIKEIENKLIGNSEILNQTGFITNNEINLEKLSKYSIDIAKKCGNIKMTIESKDITITPEDLQQMFYEISGTQSQSTTL